MDGAGPIYDLYVDGVSGNDANAGTLALPKKTLGSLSGLLAADKRVGLKRGSTFRETWNVEPGGSAGHSVIYGAYGSGNKPKITGTDLLTGWSSANIGAGLFTDGFESGDTSAWTSVVGAGAHISVTAGAALVGTKGLAVQIADTTAHTVRTTTSNGKKIYRCRFWFDPNSITMANADEFMILGHAFPQPFFLKLQYFTAGGYKLFLYQPTDSGGNSPTTAITDAPHMIEISWGAATAAGANNGYCSWWIDGNLINAYTNQDNDTKTCGNFEMGAVGEMDAGTSGTIYFDSFASNETGAAIGASDPTPNPTYKATYAESIDTYLLLQDNTHLQRVASLAALTGAGKYFPDNANNLIYAWLTDGTDPSGHVMEIGARYDTVNCNDRNYITFNDLEIHGAGGQYGRGFGAKPSAGAVSKLILNRCEIDHCYYTGLWLDHKDGSTPDDTIQLNNCEVHHNRIFGVRVDGESAAAPITNFLIDGGSVHDNGNTTDGQFGAYITLCAAPEVRYCQLYDNNGTLDWSDNLYFVTCANAYSHHNTTHGGNHSGIHYDVHTFGRIHFNVCYNHFWNGIWVEEHQTASGDATTIYHNTCYGNMHPWVFGPGSTIHEVSGVTMKNNVFTANSVSNVELNDEAGSTYLNNVVDYNCYYAVGGANIFKAESPRVDKTFAQWKTYTSWDAHSINVDPLLVSTTDYTLQAGSLCINAGVDVGLPYSGAAPDMGAYEKA
jgi:hypothetical protein